MRILQDFFHTFTYWAFKLIFLENCLPIPIFKKRNVQKKSVFRIFVNTHPGANVIKLFLPVICEYLCWARMFDRLGWKSLPGTNTSLLRKLVNYWLKSFIKLGPDPFSFLVKANSTNTLSSVLSTFANLSFHLPALLPTTENEDLIYLT